MMFRDNKGVECGQESMLINDETKYKEKEK
jgi:hypothetical protein